MERSNSRVKRAKFLRLISSPTKTNRPTTSSSSTGPPTMMCISAPGSRSFLGKTGKQRSYPQVSKADERGYPALKVDSILANSASRSSSRNVTPPSPVSALIRSPASITIPQRRSSRSHRERRVSRIAEERQDFAQEEDPIEEDLDWFPSPMSPEHTSMDADLLERAFGITMEGSGRPMPDSPTVDESRFAHPGRYQYQNEDVASMDVPIHLAKDRKPNITVRIPHSKHSTRRPSAPCTSTRQNSGATQFSVVSPVSVLEQPKPRRPFSSFSLEHDMPSPPTTSSRRPPPLPLPNSSASSDGSSEHDDKSSSYTPRSSMSSMTSQEIIIKREEERHPSVPYSILSPADAGVFDTLPNTPRTVRPNGSNISQREQSQQRLKLQRNMKSTTSLSEKANTNKPLPPEPRPMDVAPLNISGQSLSRSGSMKARSRMPLPLEVEQAQPLAVSRRTSRVSNFSLKSKYTPKDLDALDDAFAKNGFPKLPRSLYTANSTPTLSQVTLALESQLGTINEQDVVAQTMQQMMQDPLQISRGPMRMEPSRRAPAPPSRTASPAPLYRNIHPTQPNQTSDQDSRKRLQKRSATNNHLANQMRNNSYASNRVSAAMIGSSHKANKVLGKNGILAPVAMERDMSSDSNWSMSDSPNTYTTSSSPALSPEEVQTPELADSPVPFSAFEEVRQRLELLSPKDDPSKTFAAFHENGNPSLSSLKLPIQSSKPRSELTCVQVHDYAAELEAACGPSPVELDVGDADPAEDAIVAAIVAARNSLQESSVSEEQPNQPSKRTLKAPSLRSIYARSYASIAISEIPDMYASIPPLPTRQPSVKTLEEIERERQISADAAECVLLKILENLDNLEDLFATATVSRGFYRTFKRHELPLIKNALWGMSPAAWELRESSEPFSKNDRTADNYLRDYMHDMYTMIALKSMILENCESFLRADTITALAGGETERSPQVDDAFWRVWTFCRIFGCGQGREDDIVGQMDWLQGGILAKQQASDTTTLAMSDAVAMNSVLFNPPAAFAKGNGKGLTADELYDMTEIWTCLGVLVRGFHGKRDEAREYGVFTDANIASGDVEQEDAALEEWTLHLLTLAPPTLLDVASPSTPTRATFAKARTQGYTSWTPSTFGASRSTFLKEAVSRVYEERMSERRPSTSLSIQSAGSSNYSNPTSPSTAPSSPSDQSILASRQRNRAHVAEIRAKRSDPKYRELPISEDRPMSNYPDVLERLEQLNNTDVPPIPALRLPTIKTCGQSAGSHQQFASAAEQLHHLVIPSQSSGNGSASSSRNNSPTLGSVITPLIIKTSPSISHHSSEPPRGHALSKPSTPLSQPQSQSQSQSTTPTHSPSTSTSSTSTITSSTQVRPQATRNGSCGQPGIAVPRGPQVRDPVDVAVEKLVARGFSEREAKRALAETDSGQGIDFEMANARLEREREIRWF
ncbi:hypothetical protein MMC09_001990 [Bachmanniomyces sp. S44760]|nr:hypothetical protein [Bachmanniomyces sp. S44760]